MAGDVSDITTEIGQRVVPEKSLVTIVPQGSNVETWLYAPSSAIGFARPGQQVRLRFDAYPYQKYGVGKGTIIAISRVAIDPAELETMVREELQAATAAIAATQTVVSLQSFRPGRPVPTHRIL